MGTIRYIVKDVGASVNFYTRQLGFKLEKEFGAAMAIVSQGDVSLWLAGPDSSAARPMLDGSCPAPGGWNRIVLQVENLAHSVSELKKWGVRFRSEIVTGPGGSQILCEDPSGNIIELFQP